MGSLDLALSDYETALSTARKSGEDGKFFVVFLGQMALLKNWQHIQSDTGFFRKNGVG